jgi:hypothetical protein
MKKALFDKFGCVSNTKTNFVSNSVMKKMLDKIGFSFKKVKKIPLVRNSDKIINSRYEKACIISYYMQNNYNIIYIDETSVSENL